MHLVLDGNHAVAHCDAEEHAPKTLSPTAGGPDDAGMSPGYPEGCEGNLFNGDAMGVPSS